MAPVNYNTGSQCFCNLGLENYNKLSDNSELQTVNVNIHGCYKLEKVGQGIERILLLSENYCDRLT